jgi:hypothetical protein
MVFHSARPSRVSFAADFAALFVERVVYQFSGKGFNLQGGHRKKKNHFPA